MYGDQIALSSDDHPPSVFDELVVDQWFHMEQMDSGLWWMSIAGVVVHVNVNRDGKATRVRVDAPGDYDAPVPGVTYEGAVGDD
jgi:hypothetical protein